MARVRARDAIVTISAPAWVWILLLVAGATLVGLGATALKVNQVAGNHPIGALFGLFGWLIVLVGCGIAAQAWVWAMRRTYVTSDAVIVRGFRRRTIAWRDVRTIGVRRRSWAGDHVVEITPEAGGPVVARVRTGWLDSNFERDHWILQQQWHMRVGAPADR